MRRLARASRGGPCRSDLRSSARLRLEAGGSRSVSASVEPHGRYRLDREGLRLRLAVPRPRTQFDRPRRRGAVSVAALGAGIAPMPGAGRPAFARHPDPRWRRLRHRDAACRRRRGGARDCRGCVLRRAAIARSPAGCRILALPSAPRQPRLRSTRDLGRGHAGNPESDRQCSGDRRRARHRFAVDRNERSVDEARRSPGNLTTSGTSPPIARVVDACRAHGKFAASAGL